MLASSKRVSLLLPECELLFCTCAELVSCEEDDKAALKVWAELGLRFGLIRGLAASLEPPINGQPDPGYARAVSEGRGYPHKGPRRLWGTQCECFRCPFG